MPAPGVATAVSVIEAPAQNGLLADDERLVIDGAAVIVYTWLANGAVVTQPDPLYARVTLYAPVVAPPAVVNDGDTLVALVAAVISGPLHE